MLSACAIGAGVMACADTAKDKANVAIPSDLIIPTSLEAPNPPDQPVERAWTDSI
jgi:hypothetical protein